MKYKLMAVDIDGTLLNSRSELTEHTRVTVRDAVATGLVFVLSTGRPLKNVERFNAVLGADMPFITYNGAVVVMGMSQKRLFSQTLHADLCREVIDAGLNRGVSVMLWKNGLLYTPSANPKNDVYEKLSGFTPIIELDLDKLSSGGADKALWCDAADRIGPLQSEMWERFNGRLNCHTSSPRLLEFVDINVSKGRAMEKLGVLYGIRREEMIAVGDGYNDLSMIEYAGLGVAMANAEPAIRDQADFVTRGNDEDGVAYVIERFIHERD